MRIYTRLPHKRVLTPIPTEWTRMLLLFQWQRLRPAVMRLGKDAFRKPHIYLYLVIISIFVSTAMLINLLSLTGRRV